MGRKKSTKLPNVLNKEHLVKLFDEVDKPKIMVACLIGFFCGLRINEVCRLRIDDFDLYKRLLKVIDGKGGKDRYVTIPRQIVPLIKLWIEILGQESNGFFLPSSARPNTHMDKKSLSKAYVKYLERANLRPLDKHDSKGRPRYRYCFHTLRHSYATFLLEKGVPIDYIQRLLGHNQIETTQIYAHISSVELQKRVDNAFENPSLNNYERINSNFTMPKPEIKIEREMAPKDPIELLRFRLAKGEIEPEDFRKRIAILQGNLGYIG